MYSYHTRCKDSKLNTNALSSGNVQYRCKGTTTVMRNTNDPKAWNMWWGMHHTQKFQKMRKCFTVTMESQTTNKSNLLSMKKLRKMNTRGHYAATEKEQSFKRWRVYMMGKISMTMQPALYITTKRTEILFETSGAFVSITTTRVTVNKITNLLQFQLPHSSPHFQKTPSFHWHYSRLPY